MEGSRGLVRWLLACLWLWPLPGHATADADTAPVTLEEARRLSSEDPRRFLDQSAAWLVSPYSAVHPDWRRELLLRRGRAAWFLSDRETARAAARDLSALADAAGMPLAQAYARLLAADEFADGGRFELAIEQVTAAAEIMRATGDPYWKAIARLELCDVYWGSEREEEALQHCRRADKYLRSVGDEWNLARLENMTAMLLEIRGETEQALATALSARARFERMQMPSMVAMMDDNMSSLYLARGDKEQALAVSQRSLAFELASGKLLHAVSSRINIAIAQSALGRHAEALATIREAIGEAEKHGFRAQLPGLHKVLSDVAEAAGQPEVALQAAREALALAESFTGEREERAVAEMQARYDAAEKQREIERLDQAQRIRELELARSREENARQGEQLARQDLRLLLFAIGGGAFALISALLFALWRASRRHGERLRLLADTDGLTRVLNRRAFLERAQQAWERLQAEGGAASIALVDADYFKKINDTRGHQVGDRTLQRIAAALQADLAAGTPVGRMGGEEFAVLLAGADTDAALAAAEAARARVGSDHLRPEGVGFPVTVSIGVASLHAGKVASVEDWLLAADKALYAAKAAGRNRVFVAGPEQFLRTATI